VLDLGSGAGLDAIIAAWKVGPSGAIIGRDLNPAMCMRAKVNAEGPGTPFERSEGRMEDIPLEDASVDVGISNGVLKPGGRISITDIVSAKQLSHRSSTIPSSGLLESGVLSRRESCSRSWRAPAS
jgi:arsenite methyltransferase